MLTLDNRYVDPGPAVDSHGKACGGAGNVHRCTVEPDTEIVNISIAGQAAGACATIDATKGGSLVIDFVAYDPDGHLGYYCLKGVLRGGPLCRSTGTRVAHGTSDSPSFSHGRAGGAARGPRRSRLRGRSLRPQEPRRCRYGTEEWFVSRSMTSRLCSRSRAATSLALQAFKRPFESCSGGNFTCDDLQVPFPQSNTSEVSFMVSV